MRELDEQCDFPYFIHLKAPPLNANVRTSKGLDYGEIYFSSYHLQAIDLPLYPLIHCFLSKINLCCCVQLYPDVFRILSCALLIDD